MTRRPAAAAAVTAILLATLGALPAEAVPDAAPTRLFLHSAKGTYAEDAIGTSPYSAPAGSTATTASPSRATSATARYVGGQGGPVPNTSVPGTPNNPTWSLPVAGVVRTLCLDLFLESVPVGPLPPTLDGTLRVTSRIRVGGATGATYGYTDAVLTAYSGGIVRFTALAPGNAIEVTPGSSLVLTGILASNPGWTLHYDSAQHFSSVLPNLPAKRCTPKALPAPRKPA